MDGIGLGELKVHAIKYVLLVALVMYGGELRRVEKATTVQPVDGDKISPLLASVREIKSHTGRAKAAVGSGEITVRRGHSLPGARCNVNHNACFLAEFGGRRAGNYFQRLN